MLHLITIHANLMASNDCLEAVVLAEPLGDVGTELHTNTSLAGTSARLLLGVGPEHLHHQASLAGLSLVVSVQFSNVIKGDLVVGEQASMKDEVLLANQGSKRQGRETFREELEDPSHLVSSGTASRIKTITDLSLYLALHSPSKP